MTDIIMHGCNGHMGQVITDLVKKDDDACIVAGIDVDTSVKNDYPVFSSIDRCDVKADVIIDFSTASAVDLLLDYVESKHIPLVLCTTGLSEEQLKKVDEVSKSTAILRSANMSLGINTLMKLLEAASSALKGRGYDIEILEKHHNQKLDAPSGTALALADCINDANDGRYTYVYDRSTLHQKRSDDEIGISSMRGGTIVGEHDVMFAGTDEVIEIKHTAYSKAVFAKGAIDAAKFLKGKTPGMYQMSDVIEDEN